ncbi:MAG: hypothetical protein DSZ23_04660 [Thermodesulfatator sp.]|nr:MAG: hypothetical protein DSZ23_04660 [Thermodesulfatator sp.]
MLGSFEPPPDNVLEEVDAVNILLNSTVSGLLTLAGIKADPLKSPEQLLVSSIVLYFWKRKQALNLESLIAAIINPPFQKLGVLPLETIYPSRKRMELAMSFNTILAGPGFSAWLKGEPLDIGKMLYSPEGRPRISIFSIAHLSQPERMFFVTTLLNRFLGWLRRQPGSSSLRCLLYMDEIAGYFPPTAAPPSKKPMLLLLRQARAYGAGIILSTQNPVDLDYKGLSNIGTWFIGRLQTRQDQDKVLDGLKSAGKPLDVPAMRKEMSGLPGRTFLLRSVHLDNHVVFKTRWVMSYLRGPLTLEDIRRLCKKSPVPPGKATDKSEKEAVFLKSPGSEPGSSHRPILSSRIRQFFLVPPVDAERFMLRPCLYAWANVRFVDSRRGIDITEHHSARLVLEGDRPVEWAGAGTVDVEVQDLSPSPPSNSIFYPLPQEITRLSSLAPYRQSWADFLYTTCRLELYRVKALKLETMAGESMEDFMARVSAVLASRKAESLKKLKRKYEKRYRALEDRLNRAEARLEKEKTDVTAKGVDTVVSFGVAILGALFGRKALSASSAYRTGRGIRSAGRMLKEKQDVERAREEVSRIQEQLSLLSQELEAESARISDKFAVENYPVEKFFIKPRRTDIIQPRCFLVWEAQPTLAE